MMATGAKSRAPKNPDKPDNGNGSATAAVTIAELPEPGPDYVDDTAAASFTFTPKDGEPIEVPKVSDAIPYERERWFFWKLRKLRGLEQPIFWLEQAGVPESVQERVMLLDDAEWARFFKEWMANGSGAGLGE